MNLRLDHGLNRDVQEWLTGTDNNANNNYIYPIAGYKSFLQAISNIHLVIYCRVVCGMWLNIEVLHKDEEGK